MNKDKRNKEVANSNGIFNFIFHTNFLGNLISAAGMDRCSLEPLPCTNERLFHDNYGEKLMRIHKNPHSTIKYAFFPNIPIKVEVKSEKKHGSYKFSSNIYTISFVHKNHQWEVVRTYKELKELHKNLSKKVIEELGKSISDISKDDIKSEWPLFPVENDHFISNELMHERCKQITDYLEKVLVYPPFRDHPKTLRFVGVSHLSFIDDLGPSLYEGPAFKCMANNINFCRCFRLHYKERWLVLKDTYLVYLNPQSNNLVGFVMLIDTGFKVTKKRRIRAYHSLEIKNLQHTMFIKFKNSLDQNRWYEQIYNCMKKSARYFHDKSLLPNGSYAPVRKKQLCKWYINSSQYMEHVMNALNNAKEEIFITDWWLCPELFLVRPTDNLEHRLDKILLKKSQEGVKVYIILFKEVKFTIPLWSSRAKKILTENGENLNIRVLRHPERSPAGVFLWSNHEKMVIIDQSVAFMGGIDLCYGRWDDDYHRLVDLGSHAKNSSFDLKFPEDQIPDFSISASRLLNVGRSPLKKISNVKNNTEECSESIVSALIGNSRQNTILNRAYVSPVFSDTEITVRPNLKRASRSLSFDQKKFEGLKINFTKTERIEINDAITEPKDNPSRRKNIYNTLIKFGKNISKRKRNFNTFSRSRQKKSDSNGSIDSYSSDEGSISETEEGIEKQPLREGIYWIGKDYLNIYKSEFKKISEYQSDYIDRTKIPRVPWRDQCLVVIGESARDLARHFIQRWNQCKKGKARKIESYPFLLPKAYPDAFDYDHSQWFKEKLFKCEVQMLRSLSKWSGGISETESSIYKAYTDLIQKAEQYIYIENQFLITTTDPKDTDVINMIGGELVNRIFKAHLEKKNFRVYIVLPLLPGFDKPNAINAVQYYNLRSIINGDGSIIETLRVLGVEDPYKYISFHGMRNWGILSGNLVQEIVYVHSKLMIVDDKYVICGSANINDRSLLGKRDSEVAAIVKDEEYFESVLDGKKVFVGKYANSLRKKIFKLHLGIYFNNSKKIDVQDCVCDEFYEFFRSVSKQNTDVYDEVFKCLPSDNITNFEELKTYEDKPCLSKINPARAKKDLEEKVKGFIVDFPLIFLSKEKYFFPEIITPEGMVPQATWT